MEQLVCIDVQSDKIIENLPKEFEPPEWKSVKTGLGSFIKGPAQSRLM